MQSRGKIMVELAQKLLRAGNAAGHLEAANTSEDFSSDDSLADTTYCPNKHCMDDSTEYEESTAGDDAIHKPPPVKNVKTPPPFVNHNDPPPPVPLESHIETPSPLAVHQAKKKKSADAALKLLNECSCKKKCGLTFQNFRRQAIFDQFSKMNFAQRQLFFEAFILQNKKHYHSSSTKRKYTYVYHLPLNAQNSSKQIVCKTMFLHTIGRKTDGLITEFFKRRNVNSGLVPLTDHRGDVVNRIKVEKSTLIHNQIRDHILSFHPQVSHYKLEHAPNRRYLLSEITVKFMWNDFITKFENAASYVTYSKIFKKENIGFDKPSQDECPVCAEHKQHQKELKDVEAARCSHDIPSIPMMTSALANHSDDCVICQRFVNHKLNYIQARKYYKIDKTYEWPQTVNLFTVDMQKVIIIPKMKSKNSYFVSRLVVFNETFAPLHQHDQSNLCVLWHEAITGRSASDVASSFLNIIQQSRRDVSKFIFWADNCSAQNKNWILYSALLTVVNQNWSPETITIKYFEPGHSYMRSDSVHGNIGKKWKNTQEVLDMDDLVDLIKKADGKNVCRLLTETDFYNFKNICQKRTQKNELPFLKDLCPLYVVEFRRGPKNFINMNVKLFMYLIILQN